MGTLNVKGMAELQRALQQLPVKMENNVLKGALRAGVKVLAAQAKANVPEQTGALAQSIRFGADSDRKSGKLVGYVRAGGRGKNKKGGKALPFYAHMVEFGTLAHVIKARPPNKTLALGVSSVQHPGAKKHPFLRPAFEAHSQAAMEAMREYIRKRLATKHGIDVPAPVDPEAEQ